MLKFSSIVAVVHWPSKLIWTYATPFFHFLFLVGQPASFDMGLYHISHDL